MLTESTRQFDLYDFFSVLIPGAVLIIGLLPFFPSKAPVLSTGALIVLLIGGFVIGRVVHALGLLLERPLNDDSITLSFRGYGLEIHPGVTTNHREVFIQELCNPSEISADLVTEFYERASDYTDLDDLPGERTELDQEEYESELRALYTITRSYIHMDARGRSRTFQAVLDFQRTTMITSLLLFFVYFCYGFLKLFGFVPGNLVDYQSYLFKLDVTWWLIVLFAVLLLVTPYITFERIRSDYRHYFVEYLFSDFINLRKIATDS